jgi:hypothetical protein
MILRQEEKVIFSLSDFNSIKNFILLDGAKEIYSQRKISSIYFENKNFQMFNDSIEGYAPRKKIRIRSYSNFKNKFYLEKKITDVDQRYKIVKEISEIESNLFQKKGIYDSVYGNCYPIIKITFNREYFTIKEKRLTLDYDMEFQEINSMVSFRDNSNLILEIKTENNSINKNNYLNFLPFLRSRYSKYCEYLLKVKSINI